MRFILLIFFLIPLAVHSQCCSGGVPIASSLGLSSIEKNKIEFLISYDYNRLNQLFNNNVKLGDNSRLRNTHSFLTEINYGINKKLFMSGLFSIVRQERKITRETENFTATNGVGDALFLLKYGLLSYSTDHKSELLLGIGVKAPLGRSDLTDNGINLPADLQPGSGAWDVIFWNYFSKGFNTIPNFNINTAITYRLTGTNSNYLSSLTYKFGNELQVIAGSNYRLNLNSLLTDILLSFKFRNQTHDLINASVFPNSGGKFLFVIPGININFSPQISLKLTSDIPLYRFVDGTQLTTSNRFSIGFNYTPTKPSKNESNRL